MKKIYIVLIAVLISAPYMLPQSDTPVMRYYSGGELNFNMNFSMSAMGGGYGSGTLGRVISPLISTGAAAVFTNPAELGLMNEKAFVFFDTKFSLDANLLGVDFKKTLDESLKETTDDFLKDTTTFKFPTGGYKQSTKTNSFEFGQPGGFGTFAISLPVHEKAVIAFAVNFPIDFSLSSVLSGVRTKLESVKQVSEQEVRLDMPLALTITSDVYFRVNAMTIGVGSPLLNTKFGRTHFGLALTQYNVTNYINYNMQIDGMMVLNRTQEYHFNNPNDQNIDFASGQTNEFGYKIKANYDDSKWGVKFGILHQFENFNISLAYDYIPEFEMSDDNAYGQSYQPKFMTGRVLGEGDEALNIIIDSLDLARPNLTAKADNPFTQKTRFQFPSSLTIGADYKWGDHAFALNIVKYLNEMSYEYDRYKFGKDVDLGIKFGANIKLADKVKGWGWALIPTRLLLFLDFDGLFFQTFGKWSGYRDPHYIFEAGLMFGDGIAAGFQDPAQNKDVKSLLGSPLPSGIGLSREYTIFNDLRIGVKVFTIPDFALRFGVGYAI